MNIKKIGLTALAGSLVATTAFAGELSLSGSAKFSYKSMDGTNERVGASTGTTGTGMDTASPFAMDQEITASGSAELDNGMTVSVSHGLATGGSGSDTSTLTLDMGDMGKLAYSDTDISGGLKALDDITPTAYEEADHGSGSGLGDLDLNGSENVIAYNTTVSGMTISAEYNPGTDVGTMQGDGGTQTDSVGTAKNISIKGPLGDGVTVGLGYGEEESNTDVASVGNQPEDDKFSTGFVTYAMGAITVGYQMNEVDSGTANEDTDATMMGISYAVSDDLSVSINTSEVDIENKSEHQEATSVSFSYTTGGLTISGTHGSMDNIGGTATSDESQYELNFGFAF